MRARLAAIRSRASGARTACSPSRATATTAAKSRVPLPTVTVTALTPLSRPGGPRPTSARYCAGTADVYPQRRSRHPGYGGGATVGGVVGRGVAVGSGVAVGTGVGVGGIIRVTWTDFGSTLSTVSPLFGGNWIVTSTS